MPDWSFTDWQIVRAGWAVPPASWLGFRDDWQSPYSFRRPTCEARRSSLLRSGEVDTYGRNSLINLLIPQFPTLDPVLRSPAADRRSESGAPRCRWYGGSEAFGTRPPRVRKIQKPPHWLTARLEDAEFCSVNLVDWGREQFSWNRNYQPPYGAAGFDRQ